MVRESTEDESVQEYIQVFLSSILIRRVGNVHHHKYTLIYAFVMMHFINIVSVVMGTVDKMQHFE